MIEKKLLLIAFKFPPMGGVGSRRWAKFVKYLSRRGYEIDVITTDYNEPDKVNWLKDISLPNVIVHRLPSGIPLFWVKESKTFFDKIMCYIFNRTIRPFFYYIDDAQCWNKYLIPFARDLIVERQIKNVLVTGPPHTVNYYCTYLKIENPVINLILDFRDNWNDDFSYYYKRAFKHFWQKENSVRMEDFSICHSDKIVFVTNDIKNRYTNLYPGYKDKFTVVYNGYDVDDKIIADISNDNQSKIINIIYAGILSLGREKAIALLAEAIDEIIKKHGTIFHVNIYSPSDLKQYEGQSSYDKIKKYFSFHKPVDPKSIFTVIAQHDVGLSINSESYPYAFGTKIYDYMVAEKRIFLISEEGELFNVLRNGGAYAARYNVDDIISELERMIEEFTKSKGRFRYHELFNLDNLTTQIEALLI